ncbi:MAG TPA: hypothetical protein VFB29_06120 [Pseudolabrys sp.]|nr:hypothetical protein [Pseudolabrys sp.]
MCIWRPIFFTAACLLAFVSTAPAQGPPRGQQQPARPGPYTAVTVTAPQPLNETALEALRKQLAEVAQRKDRSALAKLVVSQGFFWIGEKGDRADKRRSGVENLVSALGLNNKDGAGWDMLASFADDPTGAPSPERKDAVCAPADPAFDGKAFRELLAATKTDVGEWGYPVATDVEVRATPQANAPVIEKLGAVFLRIVPEGGSNVPTFLRVVTPAGKTGFVAADSLAPIGNDQLCYVKDAGGWKIGGYIGTGDSQ